jgi:hypothetical protein
MAKDYSKEDPRMARSTTLGNANEDYRLDIHPASEPSKRRPMYIPHGQGDENPRYYRLMAGY